MTLAKCCTLGYSVVSWHCSTHRIRHEFWESTKPRKHAFYAPRVILLLLEPALCVGIETSFSSLQYQIMFDQQLMLKRLSVTNLPLFEGGLHPSINDFSLIWPCSQGLANARSFMEKQNRCVFTRKQSVDISYSTPIVD